MQIRLSARVLIKIERDWDLRSETFHPNLINGLRVTKHLTILHWISVPHVMPSAINFDSNSLAIDCAWRHCLWFQVWPRKRENQPRAIPAGMNRFYIESADDIWACRFQLLLICWITLFHLLICLIITEFIIVFTSYAFAFRVCLKQLTCFHSSLRFESVPPKPLKMNTHIVQVSFAFKSNAQVWAWALVFSSEIRRLAHASDSRPSLRRTHSSHAMQTSASIRRLNTALSQARIPNDLTL